MVILAGNSLGGINSDSSMRENDLWGMSLEPAYATLSTQARKASVPSRSTALSSSSSPRSTPVSSPTPPDDGWDSAIKQVPSTSPRSPAPSMAGMTKEDKAAEMLRRKEERKQVSDVL